jgi:hypothetical protein
VELPNQYISRNSIAVSDLKVQLYNGTTQLTSANAGQTYLLVDSASNIISTKYPRPGDMFNIDDGGNANHVKTYRITRVENHNDYTATLPDGNTDEPADAKELRIHFTPPLAYAVIDDNSDIILGPDSGVHSKHPKIRVRLAKDVQEYNLGTNNLYEFSLQLEEALP